MATQPGSFPVEQALKRSEDRFRYLIQATNDVIWTADPERGFIEPQEAWERFTGQDFDQYTNWGHVAAIHPEDRDRVQTAWMQATAEKRICECEYRVYNPHYGEYRYCAAKGVPILDESGEIREWVGTLADIHERKALEQMLVEHNRTLEERVKERTEELVATTRELERLTYAMAHDLRAPLRAIIATSRILESEKAEDLDTESREFLLRQRKNAEKMAHSLDEMLRLTRLREEPLRVETGCIGTLAKQVVEQLRFDGKVVALKLGDLTPCRFDPVLMRLALRHLVDNAIKYAGTDEPAVEVSVTRSEVGVLALVKDNGIGFKPEYASRIWEPFVRLHREEEIPGAGVGLPTVKRIVEKHGGSVWAESEPGAGTRVSLLLPA